MDDRLCIANMAIEAGAKNGIFMVDEVTENYMKGRVQGEWKVYTPDDDAEYVEEYEIDLSALKPTVSFPHLPENTKTIDEVGDVPIPVSYTHLSPDSWLSPQELRPAHSSCIRAADR